MISKVLQNAGQSSTVQDHKCTSGHLVSLTLVHLSPGVTLIDQVMKHCPLSFAFALLLGSFCWKHHFQFVLQNSRMVLGLEPPDVMPGVMVVYIEKGNLQI